MLLFLGQTRSTERIDLPLQFKPTVIGYVDRSSQVDELLIEFLLGFLENEDRDYNAVGRKIFMAGSCLGFRYEEC